MRYSGGRFAPFVIDPSHQSVQEINLLHEYNLTSKVLED